MTARYPRQKSRQPPTLAGFREPNKMIYIITTVDKITYHNWVEITPHFERAEEALELATDDQWVFVNEAE
jgi:hypothetical protein